MLGNENKKILVVAYQDTANEFLKDNSEVSDRLIIVNANDNKSIEDGISELINEESSGENHHQDSSTTNNSFNFIVPLVIGLIIGIIIGLGAGIFLMKRK
jgi:ABC-type phosphate transport system permease subunit